jgi:glycosyltransferase involved in cell wall biosynthesis
MVRDMTQQPKEWKVCVLISTFYPFVGGGETHARLMGREFARRGVGVLVLTRRTDPALPAVEEFEGMTIRRVGPTDSGRTAKYRMLPAAFIQLLARRRDYDAILVSGLRLLGLPAVAAAKWLGKPCVLRAASCGELSGEFIWNSPDGTPSALRRALFRPLVRLRNRWLFRADRFLAISRAIEREYLACGVSPERIERIPNGTDAERFRPACPEEKSALRRRLGIPGSPVFAYAGKLNRGKGLEFLLDLWTDFAARRPDARLLLIGAGAGQVLSCEEALRAQAGSSGIREQVTFTGYTECADDYLRAADGFVFPSENESLSNAVIEALACGLPCLASNVGGIPDSIEDGVNGRLLPPGDRAAWIDAMEQLARDPASAAAMGARARERALERHDAAAVADRYLACIERARTHAR